MEQEDMALPDRQEHDYFNEGHLDEHEQYIHDQQRNTLIAIGTALLTFAALTTASVLSWILQFKNPTDTFLLHAIWTLCGAVFAIAAAFWAYFAKNAYATYRAPNKICTILVFFVALILGVYLVVESVWLIFYRRIHYDYLVGLSTSPELWAARNFGEDDLDASLIFSQDLIWWTVITSLIGAAGCAVLGLVAHTAVDWKRNQLSYMAVYFLATVMVLFAWLSIYWFDESSDYERYITSSKVSSVIQALSIAALPVAMIVMLVNLFKSKIAYSVSALCLAGLGVALISANGLLWREIRLFQMVEQKYQDASSCTYTMNRIHEDDFLRDICPLDGAGKYLRKEDFICSKDFLTTRWEGGDFNDIRFLNPVCCLTSKYFYIWPYMFLAYWSLALTIVVALTATLTLFLSDTSERLENVSGNGWIDVFGILFATGVLVGFGIYYGIHDNSLPRIGIAETKQETAYRNPDEGILSTITIVPEIFLANYNPNTPLSRNQDSTGEVCFKYDNVSMPFPSNASSCDGTSCFVRVAIASPNSRIEVDQESEVFNNNKFLFFPNCGGLIESHAVFVGKIEDVQRFLNSLKFCVSNFSRMVSYAFYKDEVSPLEIGFNGQKPTEAFSPEQDNTQNGFCFFGFNQPVSACKNESSCKYYGTASSMMSFRTIQGRFYYLDQGQRRGPTEYIVAKAYSKDIPVGHGYALFDNGIFVIRDVAVFNRTQYILTIKIHDLKGEFLDKTVDVLIMPPQDRDDPLAAGEIRLITSDANFCSVNDTICKQNQPLKTGNITVLVEDGSVQSTLSSYPWPIANATVTVWPNHTATSDRLIVQSTSKSGYVTLNDMPYGAYTVKVNTSGYSTKVMFIDLQEEALYLNPFVLGTELSDQDVRLSYNLDTAYTKDMDLMLEIKTDKGLLCRVSPYFKYCGYAAHSNDVTLGPGAEFINIRRLTVSTYNLFMKVSPAYNEACPSYYKIADKSLQHQQSVRWAHLQQSTSTCSAPMCGSLSISRMFYQFGRVIESSYDFIIRNLNIENVEARIINFLGIPLFGDFRIFRTTSYALEDKITNQDLADGKLKELPPILSPYPISDNGYVPPWTPPNGTEFPDNEWNSTGGNITNNVTCNGTINAAGICVNNTTCNGTIDASGNCVNNTTCNGTINAAGICVNDSIVNTSNCTVTPVNSINCTQNTDLPEDTVTNFTKKYVLLGARPEVVEEKVYRYPNNDPPLVQNETTRSYINSNNCLVSNSTTYVSIETQAPFSNMPLHNISRTEENATDVCLEVSNGSRRQNDSFLYTYITPAPEEYNWSQNETRENTNNVTVSTVIDNLTSTVKSLYNYFNGTKVNSSSDYQDYVQTNRTTGRNVSKVYWFNTTTEQTYQNDRNLSQNNNSVMLLPNGTTESHKYDYYIVNSTGNYPSRTNNTRFTLNDSSIGFLVDESNSTSSYINGSNYTLNITNYNWNATNYTMNGYRFNKTVTLSANNVTYNSGYATSWYTRIENSTVPTKGQDLMTGYQLSYNENLQGMNGTATGEPSNSSLWQLYYNDTEALMTVPNIIGAFRYNYTYDYVHASPPVQEFEYSHVRNYSINDTFNESGMPGDSSIRMKQTYYTLTNYSYRQSNPNSIYQRVFKTNFSVEVFYISGGSRIDFTYFQNVTTNPPNASVSYNGSTIIYSESSFYVKDSNGNFVNARTTRSKQVYEYGTNNLVYSALVSNQDPFNVGNSAVIDLNDPGIRARRILFQTVGTNNYNLERNGDANIRSLVRHLDD